MSKQWIAETVPTRSLLVTYDSPEDIIPRSELSAMSSTKLLALLSLDRILGLWLQAAYLEADMNGGLFSSSSRRPALEEYSNRLL